MDNVTLVPFLDAAIGYYYTSDYAGCVRTCDLLISHQLKTRTVLYLEAMAFRKQKKYKLSLATLNDCIALAIDSKAADYYEAKADIYETLGAYRRALTQYDTAYYIFHDPLQLYNKARLYDARLKSPRTALRYYRLYLRERTDSVPSREKKTFSFARSRTRTLAAWERETEK